MDVKSKLKYNDLESKLYIPNEIFDDLSIIDNGSHRAFAYSYYYLINYLYRNTKYGQLIITTNDIKEILGYSKNTNELNYIFKKGGVLDSINYTETTTNYPVGWELDNEFVEPVFHLVNDLDVNSQLLYKSRHTNRHTIKQPLRSFYRELVDRDINYQSGTYFIIENTHLIEFEVFDFCMNNSELGCIGFYIYSYLKMMNDKFQCGYDAGRDRLSIETGIKSTTLEKYRTRLRAYNMITLIHNQHYFSVGVTEDKRKASSNKSNHYSQFSNVKVDYSKMKHKLESMNDQMEYIRLNSDDELVQLFT